MPRTAIAALFALLLPAAVAGAEEVDHPAYLSWAARPIGTRIAVREVTTNADKTRTTTTTVTTLVERDAEKVGLELVTTRDVTGTVVEDAPITFTIRRRFPLLPGIKKEDIGKPLNPVARGTETVKAAGKEIRADWYETKGRNEISETLTRTWISNDVPGRLVKSTITVLKTKQVTEINLIELTIP